MTVANYLALSEQAVRWALNAVPVYQFYPVTGTVVPTPEYKDEALKEYRGLDTAQGDMTGDVRVASSWKYTLEGRIYPGDVMFMLLRFLFGGYEQFPTSPPEGTAQRYILNSAAEIYGYNSKRGDEGIAIIPNTYRPSAYEAESQNFIGGRPNTLDLGFKGGELATFKMGFIGGPWIGPTGQGPIPTPIFPTSPAVKGKARLYFAGDGFVPAVTMDMAIVEDFAPGTMQMAKPDDLSIKIDSGIGDVSKLNGHDGPSESERQKQWSCAMEYTHDFTDPTSGWNPVAGHFAQVSAPVETAVMVVVDTGVVIPGCTTVTYQLGLFMPAAKVTFEQPERKYDGSKAKVKVKIENRLSPDYESSIYFKLIY